MENAKDCFWVGTSAPSLQVMEGISFSEITNTIKTQALIRGKTIYDASNYRAFKKDVTFEDIYKKFQDIGARPVSVSLLKNKVEFSSFAAYLIWSWGLLHLEQDGTGVRFYIAHESKETVIKAHELFRELTTQFKKRTGDGGAFVLMQSQMGIQVHSIGVAAVKHEPTNYTDKVNSQYSHIITDLKSASPCGRIVLLDGPPGTGKSFLIRSLMGAVPEATFVMVPPGMISDMTGPTLLPVLFGLRRNNVGAIVLVIEDADHCLAKRDKSNLDPLSALLNLGDGVFGNLMDIRLLCTTNAKTSDIDEAVTRPGRLCQRVNVGYLDTHTAKQTFKRLTGEDKIPDFNEATISLANIYQKAKYFLQKDIN